MTNRIDHRRSAALRAACAFGFLLAVGAGTAHAQDGERAPLQAWLGCWAPSGAPVAADEAGRDAPVVCFVPVAGTAAVDVVSLAGDGVVERERIAIGHSRPTSGEGCTGSEELRASEDGRRVYREARHTCTGDLERRSTGLMTLLPTGEWLDVQGVSVAGYTDVQVVRYRPVTAPATVAAETEAARQDRGRAIDAARISAASPLVLADVVEASRTLDAAVVEAWLVELEQGFAVGARQLLALDRAAVPERVIDLVVALSYPDRFAVNRMLREPVARPDESIPRAMPSTYRPVYGLGSFMYPAFGYRHGYGYSRYGYGYGYGYAGYPVVIVVRGPGDEPEASPRGRAVPGRGYTRGSGGGSARPAPSPETSRPSSAGNRSGSSGSQPAAASPAAGSSGGSSTGRTARPRGEND